MQELIRLPKMELSMEEGRIQKWLVEAGVYVKKGEIIAEIETDKAVVELEMPQDGAIQRFLAEEGELVPVGSAIAELNAKLTEAAAGQPVPYKEQIETGDNQRIAISPAARRRARELGMDYTKLTGTGPRGRIVSQDLENAARAPEFGVHPERGGPLEVGGRQEITKHPLSKMRRTIARRMLESVNTIPQFNIKRTVDVSKPLEIKQVLQRSMAKIGIKLSFTDFLISAVAQALSKHRSLNASFIGNPQEENCSIIEHKAIHIGLAVSTESGLVVPVIRDADQLTVSALAKLRTAKLESVRKQTLKADDLQGGTFTISNLGMFDVDEFQAIVNPPEAGILAVGSIRQAPLLIEGKMEFRPVITLTGSFDHRVVDGAAAAEFMGSIAKQLESDEWILM